MSVPIPESYCLVCKGETGNINPQVLTNKKGNPYLRTDCMSCHKGKSRMIPKGGIKQGAGFFRDAGKWLTGAAGSALGGIMGSVVPGAGTLIGSAAGGYAGSLLSDAIFGKGLRGQRRVVRR